MTGIKIVSVVGARPNFVKLAAVEPIFRMFFDHIIVHTGQHYDYEMSKVFFENLDIPEPHYYLGVGSGSHGYQVGEMIKKIEEILTHVGPNLVVVYGDTNSTLAGALAAVKAGFEVAHVEAGLRSFDLSMPEEINRRVVDHVSRLLFAPTPNAMENLKKENVMGEIFLTGDVHVDVLAKWINIAEEKSKILQRLKLTDDEYIIVTIHRAENVDNVKKLELLLTLVRKISNYVKVVFPTHPRTRHNINRFNLQHFVSGDNIFLIEPLGYLDFLKLLRHANRVVTDSGGVQREAYLLRKPVIVLRDKTEWVELVEAGWVKLVDLGTRVEEETILNFHPRKYVQGLLGDGKASERIAELINTWFKKN